MSGEIFSKNWLFAKEKWRNSSVCLVKLKSDLNIFERRQPVSTGSSEDDSSLIEDITGAVYFQYDLDVFGEHKKSWRAEWEEGQTHSKKYFFLPQEYMKEDNEAEVYELYTNLILRMKLEKPVTVVQVEPANYKAVFEDDSNLVWFGYVARYIIDLLNPVICMFSKKDQMDQFYAALTERNRDCFMYEDKYYLSTLVRVIEETAQKRAKGDLFRYQHIEAFSAAYLHLLKTSSYISGKAQVTQKYAKDCIKDWIKYTLHSGYDKYQSNRPGVFEELQANLFHLHLTRLVYQNYFHNGPFYKYSFHPDNFRRETVVIKPAYWNPAYFGWVICDVVEAKLRNDREWWDLEKLFMKDIFQQPCFRRFLKDEQLRKSFGNFILHDYPSIMKDKDIFDYYKEQVPKMEILFRGNYKNLKWKKFLNESTLRFYANHVKKLDFYYDKVISVMDTINITTAMLAMYPEGNKNRRKYTANYLLKYMDKYFVIGRLREKCIISEEKETDNFKEMQKILATCFRLPNKPSSFTVRDRRAEAGTQKFFRIFCPISDVSSELPLDRIYELYCQSKKEKKEVNPSAGLLWLGIAHRQAIGSLGELSEEQQTNCLEMLESALDDLPLQTIETFFTSIQGFTTQKTSSVPLKTSLLGKQKFATDILQEKTPQDVDNTTTELGKAWEQKRAEIEERISAYIAQRKKEETAVLLLLHSEIGIQKVKVNANMARYEKGHKTSAAIFIFMTLFEYTDEIFECTSTRHSKKTFDFYVVTFTKYLINNPKVKDIFNKKNQLRLAVLKHIKGCLEDIEKYEQLNDLLMFDWQTYYNKWVAEKPVIGKFDLNLIRDKRQIGSGGYGITYICRYSEFVNPIVYKQFSNNSPFHSIVRELNSLMKVQSHPHVVRIFGLATDPLNVAKGIMMEYCEGGSLDKRSGIRGTYKHIYSVIVKSDYRYDGKKTVYWMAQAASALIFFRKTGVVHLDIKPANLLLCKDHHYLKIADMGITLLAEIQDIIKYESSNSQNDKFPVTTRKLGTYGFMAPEVMGSDKEKMVCSYASDIFSLGRTLWSIYYRDNPFDEIVNQTVIMPVFLNTIFDATDIPEDQTLQAVENITADMEKTLAMPDNVKLQSREEKKQYVTNLSISYAHAESKPVDMKLKCSERIAKWITRMTRFNPDARPTAVMLHEEFKKQYEEYERIEKEEALKETMATLQIIPSTKITFLHPIEANRSVVIMLENTSKTDILQWSASSSSEKIAVVPAEGEISPSEAVKVILTYGEKSVVEENMGNFIVNYQIKIDTDEPEKEWPWASKQLKIVCNL